MQFGSVIFSVAAFLVDARDAFAPLHLGEHVPRAEAVAREHDHAMEPEVGDLAHQVQAVAALCREHGFGRLFADLLQHRVVALREQSCDVGLRRIAALRFR